MRLDKYLKVSRLIKRRVIAKEASEKEKVLVNHLPAKPSKEIKIGDIITVSLGRRSIEVLVTKVDTAGTNKTDAVLMYELIKEVTEK